MSTYLYSYNQGSQSASTLARSLGIQRIRHEGSRFVGNPRKTVINWGSSEVPREVAKCRVLNSPEKIARVSNKLRFFESHKTLTEKHGTTARIPPWTTSWEEAKGWLEKGNMVCARAKLTGHSGEGLTIMDPKDINTYVKAPLYTLYIKKRYEYRIHVVDGKVILVQRKGLHPDMDKDEVDWKIRNLQNGFIFVRNEDHTPNPDVLKQAIEAVKTYELDFGAVDIVHNEKSGLAYILEINTAPGLVGSTIDDYTNALRVYIKGRNN